MSRQACLPGRQCGQQANSVKHTFYCSHGKLDGWPKTPGSNQYHQYVDECNTAITLQLAWVIAELPIKVV